MSSKLPKPSDSSSELEKLQYSHAELWAAYKQRGKEIEGLEALINRFQDAFGHIDQAIRRALT